MIIVTGLSGSGGGERRRQARRVELFGDDIIKHLSKIEIVSGDARKYGVHIQREK